MSLISPPAVLSDGLSGQPLAGMFWGKHQGSFMPAKHNFHDELSTHLFYNFIISAFKKNEYVNGGQKVCALIRKLI